MPVLDFNSTQNAAPKRFRFFNGLVFSALAVLVALGSTFAANINLTASGNDRIEFGQGVARTVVCGESEVDVLLTPNSSFINAPRSEGGGDFFFTGVTLSNIPDECLGTSFKFRAYTQNGDNPLQLSSCATVGTQISAYFNGDDEVTPTGVTDTSFEDFGDVASISNASATSFDLNWNGDCSGSPISATNIYRVTVESIDGPPPTDGSNIGGFTFVNCNSNTLDPCRLYGGAVGTPVENHDFTDEFDSESNTGPLLRQCPNGSAVIGIRVGANHYVGEVSPICASFPTKSSESQFPTWSLENPGFLVEDLNWIKEERCSGSSWLVGFGGRAGAINDALQPICRQANALPRSATLGTLFGGMGGGQIQSKRCVQGEVVTGIWVWGMGGDFLGWMGTGGGTGLAFRCTRVSDL